MAQLKLFLLGSPQLELDGIARECDSKKGVALLAYLAVTRQSHSRDMLSTLLWPDADQGRARSYLRHALWSLKKALGDGWLEISREQVELNPEANIWLDVTAFQQHLQTSLNHNSSVKVNAETLPRLAEAVELYRGDFLAGFTLPDAPEFDEWQFFQMEALRQKLAGALERLVWGYSRQGNYETAIPYGRRWVALDPLHEPAQRHLMQLYSEAGQKAAALRQYEEYVVLLEKELGLPPEEATTTLYEAIKAKRIVEPFLKAEMQKDESRLKAGGIQKNNEVVRTPPETFFPTASFLNDALPVEAEARVFVARQKELDRLDAYLAAALAGQGRIAFVIGDAGQGKTSLLQAFARHAQQTHPDLVVAGGNCNAYTGLGDPYLPFREILELLTGDVEARAVPGMLQHDQARRLWHMLPATVQILLEEGPDLLDTFVPAQALASRTAIYEARNPAWLVQLHRLISQRTTTPVNFSTQQSALFEQYAKVIQQLGNRIPLLLILDDLQWADPGSISLLFHLGRRLTGHRVLILGAYRSNEVAIGRDGEPHPLARIMHEFQRDFGDITLDLSQAEAQAFVNALLDSKPNRLGPFFRQILYRQTGGHPLFTIELLRGMQERGDLVQDEAGVWEAQPSLNWNTLPARVEGAIGERISRLTSPLRELLQVASVEGEEFTAEVVAQVLNLDEREVVRRLSGELDKAHVLVQAIGIKRVGSQRLSRYRFRHILIQLYLYNLLDEVERVYQHETVGNTLERLYGEQAAEVTVQLARHFEVAQMPEKAVGYLLQAGTRASRLSAYEEAMAHFNQALGLLETLPRDAAAIRQELEVRIALGPVLMITVGHSAPEVEENYMRAQALCQQFNEPELIFPALWGLWRFHLNRPELRISQELGEQLLALAQTRPMSDLLVEAHIALGTSFFYLGDFVSTKKHLEQGYALYDPQQHQSLASQFGGYDPAVYCLSYGLLYLWLLGYPDQALAQSSTLLNLARSLSHPYSLAFALCFTAAYHRFSREVELTRQAAQECIALCEEHGFPFYLAFSQILLGWVLAQEGEPKAGLAQFKEGLALYRTTGATLNTPVFSAILAEIYIQAGQAEEAIKWVTEGLQVVNKNQERYWEVELYRLQGELLMQLETETQNEAEMCFLKAIEVARRQAAKSLELRAVLSLTRAWRSSNLSDKKREGHQLLAGICNWFTEGVETPELKQAKALLEAWF